VPFWAGLSPRPQPTGLDQIADQIHGCGVTSINIQEAKTHLSRYAKRVKAGETLILCERNKPIAEIRPIAASKRKVRLGLFKDQIGIADDFNDPLPEFERVLDSGEGGA
jgi:antitoxin (DNA-binding transcriptional repressor) of toxin-antitoxin stability system